MLDITHFFVQNTYLNMGPKPKEKAEGSACIAKVIFRSNGIQKGKADAG